MSALSPSGPDRPDKQSGALSRLGHFLARYDDGEILRWAFRGMLVGTISVLALDYFELQQDVPEPPSVEMAPTAVPILPPAVDGDDSTGGIDPRPFLRTDQTLLRRAMQFTLAPGGVLKAEGSIEPGTAARFAAELQARGEYVKTVSLNSPGGALDDAMEMGRLVHSRKLNTEVADGALCASSCPLFLAGGAKRLTGAKAAVGVHQFYAVATAAERQKGPAQAMSEAQATTARITRHLTEMGVDAALWLHALDTPPRRLYYFSAEELERYRLSTGVVSARPSDEPEAASAG